MTQDRPTQPTQPTQPIEPIEPAVSSARSRRVALILASSTGGVGRHVRGLAAGLIARGMLVSVHAPAAVEARFGFAEAGAAFRPLEIPASPQPADLRVVRVLRRDLEALGVEVAHAHGLRAGLVAGWAIDERFPLVVTLHNAVLARGLRARAYQMLERRVARMADVTLGASADLVARARELGARDARMGTVAAPDRPEPTRPAERTRAEIGVPSGAPLILSVGRLHPQKGYHTLIAAAARWAGRQPAPVVAIAGTGPSQANLATQIAELGAPVRLLGHRADVPDLLAAADLAVVSSVWEARQLFAQETLRAGVPLVATAVGGLPDLLGAGAALIPPDDVDALDAAVTRLLDDGAARRALAAAGLARASGWPSEEDTLNQVIDVYRELRSPRPDDGDDR